MRLPWLLLAGTLLGGLAGCDLPRDPQGTLDRVTGGTLRVGAIIAEPWAVREGEVATGVEAGLAKTFAASLGSDVRWNFGAEGELLAALERHELDLVIGGLTRSSPWSKRLGFTTPYFTSQVVVGAPAGTLAAAGRLNGVRVLVREGSATAKYLEDEGAVPVRVPDLSAADGPVAAPEWELRRLGLQPGDHILYRRAHVMAVPPGENAFLVRLERFLDGQSGEIEGELARTRP